jgi:hypothetical protein
LPLAADGAQARNSALHVSQLAIVLELAAGVLEAQGDARS